MDEKVVKIKVVRCCRIRESYLSSEAIRMESQIYAERILISTVILVTDPNTIIS